MDPEFRNAFAKLSSQIADAARSADAAAEVGKDVAHRVARLESHVFGSEPPPPPARPLAVRTSTAEADVDALRGQMLAIAGALSEVKRQNAEQSRALGVGMRGLSFLASREGLKLMVAAITAIAAVLAAGRPERPAPDPSFHAPVHAPPEVGTR